MNALSILMIKRDDAWTAQCLQYDIAAQGATLPEAQRAFEFAIVSEVAYAAENGGNLDSLPPAPRYYWQKFEEAVRVECVESPLRVPPEIRDLAQSLLPSKVEHRVI